ncbi:MAG: TIR domain-containing protein [Bacteroidales bacterium]|jgi:DNA-binding Lrp family transcriptional regulator|nr:TIR domain-containing protein [Bacteroidales bacterium]
MNRAFLSHSSKQKDLVRKIANSLGKAQCVFDDFEFESGMKVFDEIKKGIGNSDIFVFFISNDSLNSDWVKTEITEIKNLIDDGINKQFYPILIDNSINVSTDSRIPSWIRKYLLKPITNHFIIFKKIKQRLREISIEKNPIFKAKESLFVGRQDVFDQFEAKIYSVDDIEPKSIIVSGFEGIGRRTFLRKALQRDNRINDTYVPIYITLDSKESIEDFMLKLQDSNGENSKDFLEQLNELEYEQKIDGAKKLLLDVKKSNEYIFIIDSGCIIQPTKQISKWFLEIINDREFDNTFTLCIISLFRPSNDVLRNNKDLLLHFNLTSLSEKDTEKLFVKYCSLLHIDLKREQSLEILSLLNGIPAQTHYAVEQINEFGIFDTIKNKQDIIDFGETKVFYLIDDIKKKGSFAFDLLVLLSNFEFISYDLLYSIVGNTDEVNELLEDFFIKSVFDLIGASKEYIKIHYAIADFLTRSKAKLNPTYQQKIKNNLTEFIQNEGKTTDFQDISELLHSVKGAIINGLSLPHRYYVPSFVLKTIVELYSKEKYTTVVSLIDKVLENQRKLAENSIREFRYWLCLSLARLSDIRFETEVQSIEGTDYKFLLGFYYRIKKQYDSAEQYLKEAIKKNPNSQKSKRELVNVLLVKNKFSEALDLSKSNYENQKLNAFHIQAYFICLTRKHYISNADIDILNELLKNIKRSFETKAENIATVMQGEYEYYVNKDISKSISILKECVNKEKNKYYPKKALAEIYRRQSMLAALNELEAKYKDVLESYDVG